MDFGDKMNELHLIKYNLFKEQDLETGLFDVIFEVGGKLLFAHKTMLNLVSPTFASMLSDRWLKKEKPIKIKDYSYENFYQFLIFLYTAKCELTNENVSSMVDMAEFYGVGIFKDYCDEYLALVEITAENVFTMIDLGDKYSMIQLKDSVMKFIVKNFQRFVDSDEFMKLDKSIIKDIVIGLKDKVKPEVLFQAVYKWTEKHVIDKQAADPTLNINDAIKDEFTDFLPHIYFCRMQLKFLLDFVVSRGFIFPSYKDLSKIICEREEATSVKLTNSLGQTLHGNVIPDKTVLKNIRSLKSKNCSESYDWGCYWDTEFNLPFTSSPLIKRDGIQWYLTYDKNGQICVIRFNCIQKIDFLLAEMIPGDSEFEMTDGCKIEIE